MAIKVNNQSISKIMLGSIPVKRIYEDMQIVFDTGSTPQPCFEVVNVISEASGNYVDVYVNNEQKWYKRNNLNQYEEYGVMPMVDSLSNVTYYTGKLVILSTDTHEYKWNGSAWVDLGFAGYLKQYVFYDPPSSNSKRASFPIKYYFGTGYHMKVFLYVSGNYSGDTGSFISMANKSPIEFNMYSNGFYVDFHNPTSTTEPSVYTGDYSTRVMAQSALNNYKDTKLLFDIQNNKVVVTNFETGSQIYTGGTAATITGWYDGLYEPVYYPGNTSPAHVAYIQIYDANGNLVNDLRPKYNEGAETKDLITWYDYVIQEEYYNTTSYAVNYHIESMGELDPPEDYDTKVAPANHVHYNTLAELELMECPWIGMVATIGPNNDAYVYTDNGWVSAEIPLDIPYLRFTPSTSASFSFNRDGLKYSIDGDPWVSLSAGTPTPVVHSGSYIVFKGNLSKQNIDNRTFSATGNFSASGNAMSLLYDDDFVGKNSLADTTYAFSGLFRECSYLKSVSTGLLPATTLGPQCYYGAFMGTGIERIPNGFLPATTLTQSCYRYMFMNCSSLQVIEDTVFPATTLAANCCEYMYYGCTSLVLQPYESLPAMTLAENCYKHMFSGCSGLIELADIEGGFLPATTLATGCYKNMFDACTKLKSADFELPATTLTDDCYNHMFNGCAVLVDTPIIKATTASASHCMSYMFQNCPKVKYIVASILTAPSSSVTDDWMYGVSNTGTFYKNPNATWDQSITRDRDTVLSGWTIVNDHQGDPDYLKFTTVDDNGSTYSVSNMSVEYSIDNGAWTTLPAGNNSPLVPKDHQIRFRSESRPSGMYGEIQINSTGKYNVSGMIMTLIYGERYYGQQCKVTERKFFRAFKQKLVVDASQLILPELDLVPTRCFFEMFYGCQYLTAGPSIKAAQAGGYSFRDMFHSCPSLVSVGTISCGGTNTECCVSMFQDCTSLTSIDFNVKATTGWSLQSMCEGCTSLQSAIVRGDFTYTYAANYLFKNCTSLTTLTYLGAQSPGVAGRTNDWLLNAPATGTFYMSSQYTWDSTVPRTASGVPSGWTIVKIDPSSV